MDDKTKSIVAHITLIGWIIALVMNQNDKGPNTSFYLRQVLGLMVLTLIGWVLSIITFTWIYGIFGLIAFILWIISIIGAASGEQKPVPVVGEMFQQWFKSIS